MAEPRIILLIPAPYSVSAHKTAGLIFKPCEVKTGICQFKGMEVIVVAPVLKGVQSWQQGFVLCVINNITSFNVKSTVFNEFFCFAKYYIWTVWIPFRMAFPRIFVRLKIPADTIACETPVNFAIVIEEVARPSNGFSCRVCVFR